MFSVRGPWVRRAVLERVWRLVLGEQPDEPVPCGLAAGLPSGVLARAWQPVLPRVWAPVQLPVLLRAWLPGGLSRCGLPPLRLPVDCVGRAEGQRMDLSQAG